MVDLLNRLAGLSKEEVADVEEALRDLCRKRQQWAGWARLEKPSKAKAIAEADKEYDRAAKLFERVMNRPL